MNKTCPDLIDSLLEFRLKLRRSIESHNQIYIEINEILMTLNSIITITWEENRRTNYIWKYDKVGNLRQAKSMNTKYLCKKSKELIEKIEAINVEMAKKLRLALSAIDLELKKVTQSELPTVQSEEPKTEEAAMEAEKQVPEIVEKAPRVEEQVPQIVQKAPIVEEQLPEIPQTAPIIGKEVLLPVYKVPKNGKPFQINF